MLLEPLNRYEDHMLNRVEQAVELCDAVGRASVRVMGDLFHMNIEEDDIGAVHQGRRTAISPTSTSPTATAPSPGTGHTDFAAAFGALRDIGFDGYMAMECGIRGDAEAVLPETTRYLRSLMG